MPLIRPISDLRNKFAEISRIVHEDKKPVFLTKNGFGDMVVMSLDDYMARKFIYDVDLKLIEASDEAMNTDKRLAHDEVMEHVRAIIKNASEEI